MFEEIPKNCQYGYVRVSSKSKKYVISMEVFKYPYCGKSIESKEFLSEKICCCTIKIRKKIVRKTKRVFAYGQLIHTLVNGLAPSQAMNLPIFPTTPAIMRSTHSSIQKKVIIARVIESSSDKVIFTEKQMDQFYDLAVKCVNDSMSKEELITELRGGGIQGHLHHPKGGGRMSNQLSTNVIPTQTQVSGFVKNGQVDLQQSLDEVYRRAAAKILSALLNVSKP